MNIQFGAKLTYQPEDLPPNSTFRRVFEAGGYSNKIAAVQGNGEVTIQKHDPDTIALSVHCKETGEESKYYIPTKLSENRLKDQLDIVIKWLKRNIRGAHV